MPVAVKPGLVDHRRCEYGSDLATCDIHVTIVTIRVTYTLQSYGRARTFDREGNGAERHLAQGAKCGIELRQG